jgi:hypothetical protein
MTLNVTLESDLVQTARKEHSGFRIAREPLSV